MNPARWPWLVAALLLMAAVALHLRWAAHAGPMWRDEVGSYNLAAAPSLQAFHEDLARDNFPVGYFGLLRGWLATVGGADANLRAFGVLVGLTGFGVLCLNGWWLARRPPLLALALFGLSALAVRYGDAIRPHGTGMVMIALAFGLVWRAIESRQWRWYAAAALGATASVQVLYQNAVLVLCICLAGALVMAGQRSWKECIRVLGVGFVAAVSLLPYVNLIRHGEIELFHIQMTPKMIWDALHMATGPGLLFLTYLWLTLLLLALGLGLRCCMKRQSGPEPLAVGYAVTCLLLVLVLFPLFLYSTKMVTRPWYLLNFLALAAIAMDVIFNSWLVRAVSRWLVPAYAGAAMVLAVLVFIRGWSGGSAATVLYRQTNLDLVTAQLDKWAAPEDLIIVNPWEFGVSFLRYYHGRTPWTTVPPLADVHVHRYDLFKQHMTAADPDAVLQPVCEQITATLAAGHRVWWVGSLAELEQDDPPPSLPKAPSPKLGWEAGAYEKGWAQQAVYHLETHADRVSEAVYPIGQLVNQYESASLVVAEKGELKTLRTASKLNATLVELTAGPMATNSPLLRLRRNPDRADSQNDLGIRLAAQGRLDEAKEYFMEARRQNHKHSGAACNLGNVLAMQGQSAEAIAQFQLALRLKPEYAEAHYNLGNLLASLNRQQEAVEHLQAALKYKPDYAAAQKRLQELQGH